MLRRGRRFGVNPRYLDLRHRIMYNVIEVYSDEKRRGRKDTGSKPRSPMTPANVPIGTPLEKNRSSEPTYSAVMASIFRSSSSMLEVAPRGRLWVPKKLFLAPVESRDRRCSAILQSKRGRHGIMSHGGRSCWGRESERLGSAARARFSSTWQMISLERRHGSLSFVDGVLSSSPFLSPNESADLGFEAQTESDAGVANSVCPRRCRWLS